MHLSGAGGERGDTLVKARGAATALVRDITICSLTADQPLTNHVVT